MTEFGTIKFYNSARGIGTIVPEEGGDALPFRKADVHTNGEEPQVDARFCYVTERGDGGSRRAVNLRLQEEDTGLPEETHREQARTQLC